ELTLKQGNNATTVYSGEIEVILKGSNADSFEVKNNRITLRRGDTMVVEIVPKAATLEPRLPESSDKNLDRRAAEWVLSIGGTVTIHQAGEERDVRAAADLPAGNCQLVAVDLAGNQKVVDADLEYFHGLPNLAKLLLGRFDKYGTRVGDAGLAHLKDLTSLRHLDLSGTQVGETGLIHLQTLTKLEFLALEGTHVGNTGLVHLKGLTNLHGLALSKTRVSDVGLVHLAELTNLTHLY